MAQSPMPKDPVPAFQINKTIEGKKTPLLPMLGISKGHPLERFMGVNDVDSYVEAIHASIGDNHRIIEGSIVEACKAIGATPPQAQAYSRMSFMPDPANYGLMQWPGMQPESLSKVARENLLPQMIVRARVDDLRRYSSLSTHPWSPGWRIVLRDEKATPSESDKEDIKAAEHFIWNCSRENVYSDPRERDQHQISQFEQFLAGAVNDSLTFDGWAVWTDRDRIGRVRSFANLPAGLIRLALPDKGYKGHPDLFAALIDETGTPVAAFTRDDLTWKVRNVRTDPSVLGYGWSEIEMAVRVIQGYQSAVDLNVDTFSRSSIPNGIMKMKGDFWQQDQIDALQREWTNMKRGVSKMWGMPVVAVPDGADIEVMPFMDLKGQDVRYKDHMNMMIGVYCIIAQFPIRRLGMFSSGQHRDNQPVQDESVELQGADDPGLPAFLTFAENNINEYLLQPNWPKLRLMFMGKNPKEEARAYEAKKNAQTWGEARAAVDLPKLTAMGPTWAKPVMEIMESCPEDPAKAGIFQTLAVEMLKDKLGLNEPEMQTGVGGGASATRQPGAPFPAKKDPAASQEHGHRAGVRRNSRSEGARATAKSIEDMVEEIAQT